MQRNSVEAAPIAVIGMAARFPGADDVAQYWKNLVECVESVHRAADVDGPGESGRGDMFFVPSVARVADIEWFDADHFHVPPAEAVLMDPQQRVLLEVAADALIDAGYAGERDAVVGAFVGCGENHYLREFVAPAEAAAGRGDDIRVTLANEKDFLAPRLAFKLGLEGPAITVQTGCATALSAVALACTALNAGDCDIALAGGVSLLMPNVEGYTYVEGGILSSDGRCRAFDRAASGTVPGSGAGIVVLRRDSDARAHRDPRRAVIRGCAVNNDGGSRAGFTVPNIDGQEAVIRRALDRAGLTPDDVGFVEAHGTGTAIGDPVEFEALKRVFATGSRPAGSCTLGAVKPNIGHTDAAAGAAGLIKAVLAVEHAILPGTVHFHLPNPEIDLAATPFTITDQTRPWSGTGQRVAGVSSFGLGGSNAHVILAAASRPPSTAGVRRRHALALSARTEDELDRMRRQLAERLSTMAPDDAELADVAYTLAIGRTRFTRRWAAAVTDLQDAIAELAAAPSLAESTGTRWSLVIGGTPAELASLGTRLLHTEPIVSTALTDLAGHTDLGGLPDERAGALISAAIARVLSRLGLTFARVDAADWARPIAQWLSSDADAAALTAALAACTPASEVPPGRRQAGRIQLDHAFDLADVLAMAWSAGVAVDWRTYYCDEPRRRVPLPGYPYTRQRFWLDRPEVAAPPVDVCSMSPMPGRVSVIEYVEQVWRDVLGVEHIEPDAHFTDDLDGDSLFAVEIGSRLNAGLGLNLPIDLPFIAPTINASAAFVEQALAPETP